MPATQKRDVRSPVRDVTVRLKVDEYDRLAARKGATSVAASARLHGMSRTKLFDYRGGRTTPHLPMAMKMAADLGTTVENIFELVRGRAA